MYSDDYYIYVTACRALTFKEAREEVSRGGSVMNLPQETLLRLESNDMQYLAFRQLESAFPGISIPADLVQEAVVLNKLWYSSLNQTDFLRRCELVERRLCQIYLDYSVEHSGALSNGGWIWGNIRH